MAGFVLFVAAGAATVHASAFNKPPGAAAGIWRDVPLIPVLVTAASGPVTVGGAISDTASLSRGDGPTGTMTFRLFGPSDPTCARAPAFISTTPVIGNGTYGSASFTPARPGAYQWVASYGGDARNEPRTDLCPTGGEVSTVVIGVPNLSTAVLQSVPVATSISDTAALSAGAKPTGTLVFTAFAPGDPTCAASPAFTSSIKVAGAGTYRSDPFVPTVAGTYQFVAAYSGDDRNIALHTRCGDASQAVSVTPATLTIAGQPPPPASVGDSIVSRWTLSGGNQPSGTIIFEAFGPHDGQCSKTPAFASPPVTVSENGVYSSPSFTPTAPGTYNIVVVYSGDSNNASQRTACGAANETLTVSRAIPAFAAEPTAVVLLGQPIAAAETIAGGLHPTGTISFTFYGPNDPTCTGRPVFSSPPQPVAGEGTYRSAPFTATVPGDNRFVASYSGDADNIAFTTGCNAKDQALLVVDGGLYNPSDHPRSVIELEVLALALVGMAGSSAGGGASAPQTAAGATSPDTPDQGGVVSTGIDDMSEGWEAVVVLDAATLGSAHKNLVEPSRVKRWPGTEPLDKLSLQLPPKIAPASPLVARIANDAGYLRAMFGSASTLLPLAGVALAVVAVGEVHGHALPPPILMAMAIAVVGVLDAFAGLIAVAVFVCGVVAMGGLSTANDARTLLGLSSLWFAAPIIAGVARPLRRAPTRSTAEHVERIADVTVAALVGAWAAKQIIEGLPGLSGRLLPIANRSSVAAIVVLAALGLRMLVETAAAHRYPARLSEVQPSSLPASGRAQHVSSALVAVAVFVFVALPYIGVSWQLYAGGAFFALPILLRLWSDRFPNSPKLYAVIPRGILQTVVMLVIGTALGTFVAAHLTGENNSQIIRDSFVILSLPGLAIALLQMFARDGPGPPQIHWAAEKLLGAVVIAIGIAFVIGAVTV